jgi:hypothetical protein
VAVEVAWRNEFLKRDGDRLIKVARLGRAEHHDASTVDGTAHLDFALPAVEKVQNHSEAFDRGRCRRHQKDLHPVDTFGRQRAQRRGQLLG